MVYSVEDVDIMFSASTIRVADNLRGALSPISSVWMDLAVVVPVSEEVVVPENLPFSELQFEKVEASNWVAESKEVGNWVSLPVVLAGDTDGEPLSPLDCVPLATIEPTGAVSDLYKHVSEHSYWVKGRQGFL